MRSVKRYCARSLEVCCLSSEMMVIRMACRWIIGILKKMENSIFHCAKEGHKLDAIRACDKVSYCVMDKGYRKEDEWALNIRSVIVFGRMRIVEDENKRIEIGTNLCRKFTDDESYIEREIKNALPRALCLELTPEHITGKLVNES